MCDAVVFPSKPLKVRFSDIVRPTVSMTTDPEPVPGVVTDGVSLAPLRLTSKAMIAARDAVDVNSISAVTNTAVLFRIGFSSSGRSCVSPHGGRHGKACKQASRHGCKSATWRNPSARHVKKSDAACAT
jgi:hypothetical protein